MHLGDLARGPAWKAVTTKRSKKRPLVPQFVSHRYERHSTIITSNKSFGDWQELFGDPVIATAILDRLLHHCKVINIKGHSYRLKGHAFAQHTAQREKPGKTTTS